MKNITPGWRKELRVNIHQNKIYTSVIYGFHDKWVDAETSIYGTDIPELLF